MNIDSQRLKDFAKSMTQLYEDALLACNSPEGTAAIRHIAGAN